MKYVITKRVKGTMNFHHVFQIVTFRAFIFCYNEQYMAGSEKKLQQPAPNRWERHRLIAHLSRMFSGRYDLEVLPSGQKGMWACGLDPKVLPEIENYVMGTRDTLEDLPAETFRPKQILYDADEAQKMDIPAISSILRHEASHAKETDFRLMFEGQRHAKDEGYLPSSFWMLFEGIEDPRVNNREGDISPAIDRLIRGEHDKILSKRMATEDFSKYPKGMQYAFTGLHYWLHDEPLPKMDPKVKEAFDQSRSLLDRYFTNTDPVERKELQNQLWDIFKPLAADDVKNEQMRQMAKNKGMKGNKGQSGQSQQSQDGGQDGQEGESQQKEGQSQGTQSGESGDSQSGNQSSPPSDQSEGTREQLGEGIGNSPVQKFLDDMKNKNDEGQDLSEFSDEQLEALRRSIEQLSPEQRKELEKKARERIDVEQFEELKKRIPKMFKLEKNKKTGEYELKPNTPNQKQVEKGREEAQKAIERTDREDKAEQLSEDAARQKIESQITTSEQKRKEKLEMQKAGFREDERSKFLLYQQLEDSMYSYVRRFIKSMEAIIPRRKEPVWNGEHFSGAKINRRELVKRAPLGDEQFHMRVESAPTGTPRLFIGLVVDNSGSMRGKKQEEARKTMIFFSKVCREMGIPFMVSAFGSRAEVIKSFRQDFDNPAERIKPKLMDATEANSSSTNLHAGLDVTIEAMNAQRRIISDAQGLIFVITDGSANAGKTGSDLRSFIEERRGRLHFKAFGLSGNESERQQIMNYLNNYFGDSNCAFPQTFENLPDDAYRILRISLTQFQKLLQ